MFTYEKGNLTNRINNLVYSGTCERRCRTDLINSLVYKSANEGGYGTDRSISLGKCVPVNEGAVQTVSIA